MSISLGCAVVGGGCVRAVFSSRASGAVVCAEDLRVLLRMRRRCLSAAAVRARLADAFGGCLVSDEEKPVEWSEHRAFYAPDLQHGCITRAAVPSWAGWRDDAGGPLDAPEWIAAGAMFDNEGEIAQRDVRRGEWVEPVSVPKVWRGEDGRAVVLSVLSLGLLCACDDFLPGFGAVDFGALDAPEYLLAGACKQRTGAYGLCAVVCWVRREPL